MSLRINLGKNNMLMLPALIGISGHKGVGKDYFFKIIQERYPNCYEKKKFAGKLKEICALITGRNLKDFYDHSKYNTILPDFGLTIRELQQKVGTEAFRKNISEDIWVNALFADYYQSSRWIITDVRFLNEVYAIKDRGGIIIRIERPNLFSSDNHESETALDNYTDWDSIIINDGTLDEYINKINSMIDYLNKRVKLYDSITS